MRVMNSHIVLLVAICLLGTVIGDDPTTNDEVNIGSDKIAQLRNFQVVNHYVTSKDGYIINVIEIKPVKESSKRPVIFNHGSTQSSTYFMTNSVGARPKNFADLDAGSMSQNDLERLLKDDPVAKCFPLLLACFGHRVFLINRRGTEFSLGKTSNISSIGDPIQSVLGSFKSIFQRSARQADEPANPLSGLQSFLGLLTKPPLNLGSIPNTLDSGYWNFSLTEQVDDLVAILEFVGNLTESQKVAYVGHSFGNGLMFMLQSEHPEYADKVEPFLAWSPDFYLGHTTSILAPLLIGLKPILMAGSFPFPPTPIDPLTRTLLAALCQTKLAQRSICLLLEQAMWGFSGDQQETVSVQLHRESSGCEIDNLTALRSFLHLLLRNSTR